MIKIKRALLSVSDKTGIVDFALELHNLGVEILSTGGRILGDTAFDLKTLRCNTARQGRWEVMGVSNG